jgi:hypothetical protein
MSDKMKVGIVATNKVGSNCEFDICSEEEWGSMSEDDQQKALIEAMWESGILDVYPKD